MKKLLVSFFALFYAGIVMAGPAEDCVGQVIAPSLATYLTNTYVNYNSATLEADLTALLQPRLTQLLETEPACNTAAAKSDLILYKSAQFTIETSKKIINIELVFADAASMAGSLAFDEIMPWYGILVVKKGSLDAFTKKDLPVIPTEYMKENQAQFYPARSGGMRAWNPLPTITGAANGCTYGSHTTSDNAVINRATHVTMDEKDSFWSGNDYYVYDGKDVYWGTAQLIGEVALTVITFGASGAVSGGKAAAQVAMASRNMVATTSTIRSVRAVDLVNDTRKIEEAIRLAKAARAGNAASITAARTALANAGVTTTTRSARQMAKIGQALETTASSSVISALRPGLAASARAAWRSGLFKPWKLTAAGASRIMPKRIVATTPGIRNLTGIKRGIATAAVAGGEIGIGYALLKAFGYSTSSVDLAKDIKFSAFGLLSGDDLEGKENNVSHGSWIEFSALTEDVEGEGLNEVVRFAEELKSDIDSFNSGGECDVDIYVVQVGISNPNSPTMQGKKREAYYWLWTTPEEQGLRINGK